MAAHGGAASIRLRRGDQELARAALVFHRALLVDGELPPGLPTERVVVVAPAPLGALADPGRAALHRVCEARNLGCDAAILDEAEANALAALATARELGVALSVIAGAAAAPVS